LSNQNNSSQFQANAWPDAALKSEPGKSRTQLAGDGSFKVLYEKTDSSAKDAGFVASFVSQEKAREMAGAQTRGRSGKSRRPTAEETSKQAYEEGFTKGEQAGMEAGRNRAQEMITRLQGILSEVDTAWKNIIESHEQKIIDLVCRAAEQVVYGSVSVEQDVVRRAILKAFEVIPEPVNVHINVNPKDYEFIETIKDDFFSQINGLKDVSVIPDPGIREGGCSVQSQSGEVDATLEARLEAIRRSLISANGNKKNGTP